MEFLSELSALVDNWCTSARGTNVAWSRYSPSTLVRFVRRACTPSSASRPQYNDLCRSGVRWCHHVQRKNHMKRPPNCCNCLECLAEQQAATGRITQIKKHTHTHAHTYRTEQTVDAKDKDSTIEQYWTASCSWYWRDVRARCAQVRESSCHVDSLSLTRAPFRCASEVVQLSANCSFSNSLSRLTNPAQLQHRNTHTR